jgi:hypothetical protein
MKIDHDAKTVTVRQSWIDEVGTCPERARLSIVAPEWNELDNDESFIGTATHFGIESFLRGEGHPADIAHAYAMQKDPDEIRFIKRETMTEIADMAAMCADEWLASIWPYVPEGGHSEVTFKVPLFEHMSGYKVLLQGTADYVLHDEIWDWKTSGREYKLWEKQRYAVQPTAYIAVASLGLMPHAPAFQLPATFRYGVIYKPTSKTGKGSSVSSEILTVTRDAEDISWLMRRIRVYVSMGLEALDITWPMTDENAGGLCSSNWCPWWSLCRGAHISEDYPKPVQFVKRVR